MNLEQLYSELSSENFPINHKHLVLWEVYSFDKVLVYLVYDPTFNTYYFEDYLGNIFGSKYEDAALTLYNYMEENDLLPDHIFSTSHVGLSNALESLYYKN